MRRRLEQYQDTIARLYPELHIRSGEGKDKILSRSITFQVTDNCNLACKYCYQINKGQRSMSFETAKKCIDLLLSGEKGFGEYINPKTSPGIVLEFIGGEPLLEIELIDQVVGYFTSKCIQLMHPWATMHMISICSNGVLYFDDRVQKFLNQHKNRISFSITLDGNEKLHDSCRVFPDGRPSYALALAGVQDWIKKGNHMGSKITIAPENICYLYEAILHMIDLGFTEINANVVYEKGWEIKHATVYYHQLKKIADFLLTNELVDEIYCSLFEDTFFHPKEDIDLDNWCGGTGVMLSCDPTGWLYPCIRYMESSLGDEREPMRIGHVDTGIGHKKEYTDCMDCLYRIDRRTQSTDECFHCQIAEGCSWCSAYNYQEFGTADRRATYICDMHKARSLANAYYWNRYYIEHHIDKRFKINCQEDLAIGIISKQEWTLLKVLENSN